MTDIPDEIVEAAARAAWDGRQSRFLPYLGDLQIIEWDELVKDAPSVADQRRQDARHHLAAVYREVQALAFDDAAVRVRANFAAHGERCPWVGFLDDEAARLRTDAR